MEKFPPRVCLAAALFAALVGTLPARGQEVWRVPGAAVRFKVEVDAKPSRPEAGVIAMLPNGGALPGPFPNAVVIDSTGGQVHCECLWNNPAEGYAIVFPAPAAPGPFWIYVEGASNASNVWTADSALHPGLLLYTRTGRASLPEAHVLAGEQPPGKGSRMGQVPMIADAQNRFGPSDNFVSYYTGWINAPEAGRYFFGTISQDGSTVVIDGQQVADWPGVHSFQEGLTGSKGGLATLTKGPHRIQYFQFTSEGSPRAQLIWRLPSKGENALPQTPGGVDFVQSGTVRIIGAESHAGAPPALFDRRAVSYMNFDNDFVDLFDLSAPLADQTKDAVFNWLFSDGYQARGADILWPVVRGSPLSVTLNVSANHGTSSSTRAVMPDTLPPGARVNDRAARHDYAQALLNVLEGAPAGASPAAGWPPAFWEMLPQVVRGGEGADLLAFLFQHCAGDLAHLPTDDRNRLADIYYDEIKEDRTTALGVLKSLVAAEKDPGAQFRWELKAIDFVLFETGDVATARQIATGLRPDPLHGGKNDAVLKLIALGDVERMAGNIDKATQYYTNAQALTRNGNAAPAQFTGFTAPAATATPSGDGIVITAAAGQDADWRKRAVLENTYYTEVKNLMDRHRLDDAREKLDAWALEFPLSRLGGDNVLAEAQYAMRFNDYDRAQRILKAYRIRVDLSAQLADVMQLEWECDAALKRPGDIKELATDIRKRFPDLPIAADAQKVLQ